MIVIKTPKEIELMKEPCKIVRDVLLLAEDKIKAGMTTGELDKILHDYIISCGAIVLDLHSPDECLEIASFERFFSVIKAIIEG